MARDQDLRALENYEVGLVSLGFGGLKLHADGAVIILELSSQGS